MNRTVLTVNVALVAMFLAAGVMVLVFSNFTVGIGLCSTAVGIAYGTMSAL